MKHPEMSSPQIKPAPWIAALVLALGMHGALAVVVGWQSQSATDSSAAAAPGDQGLEIGLGQMGSYQDQVERKRAAVKPVPPQPEPQPEPQPVKPVAPKPVTPKPVVKPPVKAVQQIAPDIAPPKELAQVKTPAPTPPKEEVKPAEQTPAAESDQPSAQDTAPPELASDQESTPPDSTTSQIASRAMIKATGTAQQQRAGGKMGNGDPYLAQLKYWLNQHKDYPAELKKDKQQGVVVLVFSILRDGSIKSARVHKSSGIPRLDQAALATVANASPVPPLPDHFSRERLTLSMPIEYFLHTD